MALIAIGAASTRSDDMASPPSHERDWGELLLSAAVVVFGAVVIWQTFQIRITPAYSMVGPTAVPLIVGAGLVLVGLWLGVEALTGRTTPPAADAEDVDLSLPTDWRAVGQLALALILYLFLLEPAGLIIASTVLFSGATFAMGSKRPIRDICLGLVFAAALYVIFTAGLGLRLPEGVLAGVLAWRP
jgi:putative tricarboxylic transport membrane protein